MPKISILLIIFLPALMFSYKNPRPAQTWSIYTGVSAKIPPADMSSISTVLDVNIPLGRFLTVLPRTGIEINWLQQGSFWRTTPMPSADHISLWVKHQLGKPGDPGKIDFALTPLYGVGLLIEHFVPNTGLDLELGIIASSDILPWWRIYAPVIVSLYTDGFQAEAALGMRTWFRKIRTGIDVSLNFGLQSSYDFQRIGYRTSLELMLGGEW